ncbi:hypothetical protein JB92DRAFT_3132790 [Gautieria morchelliformis]|nr:hypothetical protein JB92DRAFT_3132790 [Gautieria morchelliformis]
MSHYVMQPVHQFAQPLNRDTGVQSNMGVSLSHPLAWPLTGDLQGPPKSRGKCADHHISQKGQDMQSHARKRRPPPRVHGNGLERAMNVDIDDNGIDQPCAFNDELSVQANNASETSDIHSEGVPESSTESEEDELELVPPTVSTKAPSGRHHVQFSSVTVTLPTKAKAHTEPLPQAHDGPGATTSLYHEPSIARPA